MAERHKDERAANWPSLVPAMAACVDAMGSEGFDDALLELLRRAVHIEQCMIFAYDSSDEIDCLPAKFLQGIAPT